MQRFLRSGCKLSKKPFFWYFFKQCNRFGKKNYTFCNFALKPLLEFLNQIKCKGNKVTEELRGEDILQCLFRTWFDLSHLSTDREPKARNSDIASLRDSVLSSLYSFKVSIQHLLRLFYVCILLKRKN